MLMTRVKFDSVITLCVMLHAPNPGHIFSH